MVSRVAEVAVVGAGYVGFVTGASLGLIGHRVTCADRDGGRVAGLREGRLPFLGRAASLVREPKLLLDGRNTLGPAAAAGLLYGGFGHG